MTSLGNFIEVLSGGLLAGVLYSLVALGFVLIFKASGVFNFAQGSMVLLAGLALVRSLDFLVAHNIPFAVAVVGALLFASLVMAFTAWVIERFVLGPLVNQDGLILFMSTIGATFIIEGSAQLAFGSDVYPLKLYPTDAWFALQSLFPGGILVNKLDVWGGLIAAFLVAGLAISSSGRTLGARSAPSRTITPPPSRSAFRSAGSGSSCGWSQASWRWSPPPSGVPSSACSSRSRFLP